MVPQQDTEERELFDVKNAFYIGNYQQCINEAQKLNKPSSVEISIQRDIYMYRSYLAQNKFLVVLDEIKDNSPKDIIDLKLLADYLSTHKREIIDTVNQKLDKNTDSETLKIVAATIFLNENLLDAAFRVLSSANSLEALALLVHVCLKLDRPDQALKKLQAMQAKDDDATLTQLAQAWVHVYAGGDKLQDAYYIYQELIDKYGSTPLLLNGQAVTFIGQAKYEEAESALQEALDKDSNNSDTLINMIVLQRHLGKSSEISNRYLSQLKAASPNHTFILDLQKKESEFSSVIQQFQPSNLSIPA